MSEVSGPAFRWLERGTGSPVVMLHGLMGHMHDWDPMLDELGDGACAIAPELPIFDPALADVSIAGLARWVVSFLDALGLGQVAIAGNSLGGHVAATIALAAPERVSALVLAGASGLFERGMTRGVPRRPTTAFVRERMETLFFDSRLVTSDGVDAVRRSVQDPAIVRRFVRVARAAKRDHLGARLRTLRVPTLLVWGREDRITPLAMAHQFHAMIPDSTLVVLRNCGHWPMVECPEAFAAITRAWLEERREAGALR